MRLVCNLLYIRVPGGGVSGDYVIQYFLREIGPAFQDCGDDGLYDVLVDNSGVAHAVQKQDSTLHIAVGPVDKSRYLTEL